MYRQFMAAAMIVSWLFFSCTLGLAHHSVAANFDGTKAVDVTGKVKEVSIRNPHSQITLEVPNPQGGTKEFYVEWSDKNALMRRSVPVNKIKVGDQVILSDMSAYDAYDRIRLK